MKLYLLNLLFLVFLLMNGCSSKEVVLSQTASSKPLLIWKVEKGVTTNYIYATFHLAENSCTLIPSLTYQILEKSKTLVVEAILDENAPDSLKSLLVDYCLLEYGKKKNIHIIPLEGREVALTAVQSIITIEENKIDKRPFLEIRDKALACYKNSDLDCIEIEVQKQFAGTDAYLKIISKRNSEWIKKIEDLFAKQNDQLVAIGAAHLAGKDSLLELLRQRGFKVTQSTQ